MAEQEEPKPKKKSPLKTLITLFGVLVVEAVVIIGAMKMMAGPAPVQATELAEPEVPAEEEKIQEILIFDGKLFNNKTGVTYLYDTEVYVQVKTVHAAAVEAELEQFGNEIKAELSAIWRTSEPHHFQEPKLETLNRKVAAMLNERFGAGADSSEPIIAKCVIVMSTGFRIDT
jgi:flagellar basal body-associated protein FliL